MAHETLIPLFLLARHWTGGEEGVAQGNRSVGQISLHTRLSTWGFPLIKLKQDLATQSLFSNKSNWIQLTASLYFAVYTWNTNNINPTETYVFLKA